MSNLLKEAREEQFLLSLSELRKAERRNELIEVIVAGSHDFEFNGIKKKALVVTYNNCINGLLPIEDLDSYQFKGVQSYIGSLLKVEVSNVVDKSEVTNYFFTANRLTALARQAEAFWKDSRVGMDLVGFVTGVEDHAFYLVIEGVTTRVPKQEYSFQYFESLRGEVSIGEQLKVRLLEKNMPVKDEDGKVVKAGSIVVSRKALEEDPLIYFDQYQIGGTYLAAITKIDIENTHGIWLSLYPTNIAVRVSFPPNMNEGEAYKVGDWVNFKVKGKDEEKRHIYGLIFNPRYVKKEKPVVRGLGNVR